MFTLIRDVGLRRCLLSEGPWLILSLVIAEFFYKFHSFVLEAVAFLVTWLAMSYVASLVSQFAQSRRQAAAGSITAWSGAEEED